MSFKSTGKRIFTLTALLFALLMALSLAGGCGAKKSDKKQGDNGKKTENALAWPTPYRDNRRTGRSPCKGPSGPDVKWTYEAGAKTKSWVVIAEDKRIISGFEGKVVSVKPSSGVLAWESSTAPAAATTCRASEDGTIYVSAGNKVYALSDGGTVKWSYDIGSEADEPSLGENGTIYAGSTGGRLVALSENGQLKWDFKVAGNIRSPSIDNSDSLYCGASPLVLYAIDKDGKKKWECKPEGELQQYPGLFAWANTLEMPSIGDDGAIYAGSNVTPGITATGQQIPGYSMPQKAKVYAITPGGQKKWEYLHPEMTYTIHSPTIARDGTLYCGTTCYRVIALNPDGTFRWEFNTSEEGQGVCPSVYSPPIGSDGLLYAATTSAKIFCITPEGTEKWRFAAEDPWLPGKTGSNNFTPPAIGSDGTLYSVLAQGRIYAFKATTTE